MDFVFHRCLFSINYREVDHLHFSLSFLEKGPVARLFQRLIITSQPYLLQFITVYCDHQLFVVVTLVLVWIAVVLDCIYSDNKLVVTVV